MQRYIPNTESQQKQMLAETGLKDFDGLFADVPESMRLKTPLGLPEALSEPALLKRAKALAAENRSADDSACFLGAGAYDHFIPSVVGRIISRQEFYTAYTPYQPEISQGTLQGIFEYQSMISMLTGMEVSNASMYDGATALAEAAMMACAATRRSEVVVVSGLNPEMSAVLATYTNARGVSVKYVPLRDYRADVGAVKAAVDKNTAAVIAQSPNFFGCIEDVSSLAQAAHGAGALMVQACEPISLALLKTPAENGADVAVGEGQPLGNALNFGGPYFGFFATSKALMRKMPGRIAGMTVDQDGRRGYVLTLQAREQHIRREKATSNICSNEALNALTAVVYLSVLGKEGLLEVAGQCVRKAHYACDKLLATGKFELVSDAPFFMEFALRYKGDPAELNRRLLGRGIIGGLDLGKRYPALGADNVYLVAVTEKRTKDEIDALAQEAAR